MIRNSDIHRLRGLFAKRLIATMDMLKKTVGTVADLTVFRKLKPCGDWRAGDAQADCGSERRSKLHCWLDGQQLTHLWLFVAPRLTSSATVSG